MMSLSDDRLFQSFNDATLPAEAFGHREHLRAGFLYLRRFPDFGEAAVAFRAALRRFTEQHGASAKYHETLTWAYLALIRERMAGEESSQAFLERCPELLLHQGGPLSAYYDLPALLADEQARQSFVLPRPRSASY